jgi:hypothetical protein
MKTQAKIFLFIIMATMILLVACGAQAAAPMAPAPTNAPAMDFAEAPQAAAPAEKQSVRGQVPAALPTAAAYQTGPDTTTNVGGLTADRLIVKNGEIRLLVKNTDVANDLVTQIVGDVRGYIVSSRGWYQEYNGENYKYATITIGVPVDQFEVALRRLRALSVRVLDETASGQDVTEEFVDLESRLGNLEATRDRIRGFLDQAKTVEEALQINQQLTDVEAQIEETKGRMNYLSSRAAYSTITIQLEPDLPKITPSPTPTRTPTATPMPWNPGATLNNATGTLTSAYQGIIELLIWLLVVVLPILAPPILIVWGLWKLMTRKPGKPAGG